MRWTALLILALASFPFRAAEAGTASSAARWENGPWDSANFFPIGVWLQDPKNAPRYKDAGINLYIGLWRGPTEGQLDRLRQSGMRVICAQNKVGLALRDDRTIVGWMHDDEPDNAQALPSGQGYGPPILPRRVIEDYESMRKADPTRPILLNLGQGVAYDHYIGRGVRRNHPEDYPEYVKGADIVSFDIYPAVHDAPEVAGKLEFVARGVQRLVDWTGGKKVVWNCLECTRISNEKTKPTPSQVRAEVWMAITHGSRGLIYFVHQFKPVFREAALLDDSEMLAAVTAINRQIHALAPVLNGPALEGVSVHSSTTNAPISILAKRHGGSDYVFAVNLRDQATKGRFELPTKEAANVEVLGESRALRVSNGQFTDDFEGYAVHLYRVQ